MSSGSDIIYPCGILLSGLLHFIAHTYVHTLYIVLVNPPPSPQFLCSLCPCPLQHVAFQYYSPILSQHIYPTILFFIYFTWISRPQIPKYLFHEYFVLHKAAIFLPNPCHSFSVLQLSVLPAQLTYSLISVIAKCILQALVHY